MPWTGDAAEPRSGDGARRRRPRRGGGGNEQAVHLGTDASSAVRPRRPAVPRRSRPVGRRPSTRSGPTPTSPSGYTGDATEAIIAQIERFAPGFRDRVVGTAVRTTTDLSVENPNFVGGDIIGGASTPTQLLFRPRVARDPYSTGIPGVWLCSASTPPGAGAHGLCGANAAARALAALRRDGAG